MSSVASSSKALHLISVKKTQRAKHTATVTDPRDGEHLRKPRAVSWVGGKGATKVRNLGGKARQSTLA